MTRSLQRFMLAAVLASPGLALAHSNGASVAGSSCGGCHNDGSTVSAKFSGPSTLAAGTVGQYTLTVSSNRAVAGLDVSIAPSAAALAAVSSSVELVTGDIVHVSPASISNGQAVFTFSVTAPSTSGQLALHGKAVAGNGGGDGQATTTSLTIDVSGGSSGGGQPPGAGAPADMSSGPVSNPQANNMDPAMPSATSGGCSVGASAHNASPIGGVALFSLLAAMALLSGFRARLRLACDRRG